MGEEGNDRKFKRLAGLCSMKRLGVLLLPPGWGVSL